MQVPLTSIFFAVFLIFIADATHIEASAKDVLGSAQSSSIDSGLTSRLHRVEPEFHSKEFIHDAQPPVGKKDQFHFPYPKVQRSDDFDYDFVKDDNGDGGAWNLQMDYDIKRHNAVELRDAAEKLDKVAIEKEENLEDAMEDEGADQEAVKKAQKKVDDARKAADVAEKEADDAEKHLKDSNEKLNRVGKGINGKPPGQGRTGDECAVPVEEAKDRVEELEKKLKEAKEVLKQSIKEKTQCVEKVKMWNRTNTSAMEAKKELKEEVASEEVKEAEAVFQRDLKELKQKKQELDDAEKEKDVLEDKLKKDSEIVQTRREEHDKALKAAKDAAEKAHLAEDEAKSTGEKLLGPSKAEKSAAAGVLQSIGMSAAIILAFMMVIGV